MSNSLELPRSQRQSFLQNGKEEKNHRIKTSQK